MRVARTAFWFGLLASQSAACADDADDADDIDVGDVVDATGDAGLDSADGAVDEGDVHVIDRRFAALAEAIEADLDRSEATAASVAVWLEGEVVWVGAFGSLEGGRTVDSETLFMIGSDTKKLTAITALQAVERGLLEIETTIADVFPDLEMDRAADFTSATLHDLISHQGGIVDGVEGGNAADDSGLLAYVFGDFAAGYYQLAPPGRIWNYSNPNFSLAALLVEDRDGRPWADIVEEDVFAPLGMTRSFARKSELDDNVAPGIGLTAPDDQTVAPVSIDATWESAFVRPSGLVWSTPSDQMRLAAFLVDGDDAVLSDTMREALIDDQVAIYPDLPGHYGYGVFLGDGFSLGDLWYDVEVLFHGGNTWTHTSTFYVLPEQRFAISILSNGLGDDFAMSVATAFSTLVELPEPSAAPEIVFDADALDQLVGSYFDDNNAGELIISRVGDTLRLDAPLLDSLEIPYEHEMTPTSTRVWTINAQGQDLDFAFIDGPDGETYLRNRSVVAIRPPAGVAALRQRPPSDEAQRARLVDALREASLEQARPPRLPAPLR